MGLRRRENDAVRAAAARVHRRRFGDAGKRIECKGESKRNTQGFLTSSCSSELRSRRWRSSKSANSSAVARFKGCGAVSLD